MVTNLLRYRIITILLLRDHMEIDNLEIDNFHKIIFVMENVNENKS